MPFEKFIAELFYPKLAENRATTQVPITLASVAATMIMMELTDTRKATSKNLSCIQGKCSISDATEQINQDVSGNNAINSVFRVLFCGV